MTNIQQSLSDILILYNRKQNIDLLLPLINTGKIIKDNNINAKQNFNEKIKELRKIYKPDYEFPEWVTNINYDEYVKYAKSVVVYYNEYDNDSTTLKNVKLLVEKREPVNITMNRGYDKDKLNKLYGYENGVYDDFDDSINIAMFIKTPIKKSDKFGKDINGDVNDANMINDIKYDINVLNVVAPAFDIESQPDYKKFFKLRDENIITKRFELIFDLIFNCAIKHDMNSIYLCGFGLGAYKNDKKHYINGFLNSYKKYKINIDNKITLYLMDRDKWALHNDFVAKFKNIKLFKINFTQITESFSKIENLKTTLFINAWDSWSIVGNGNKSDFSWDGQFGRRTALSILSLPQFNEHIKYESLNMPNFIFKQGPAYTPIYDENPKGIFGSVNAGDTNLYVGGGTINGAFGQLLSSVQEIGKYQGYHEKIRGNNIPLIYDPNHLLTFLKNTSYNEDVFIHEFADNKCPKNKLNKFMIYIVPPNGKDEKYLNNSEKFLEDVGKITYNMMALIDKNEFSRKIKILRICLFSGMAYKHNDVEAEDVAKTIIENITIYITTFGTSLKIIEFAYGENKFINAWNDLLTN